MPTWCSWALKSNLGVKGGVNGGQSCNKTLMASHVLDVSFQVWKAVEDMQDEAVEDSNTKGYVRLGRLLGA